MTGPSGVGKSTVSRLVAATSDKSVHLSTDDVTRRVVNGWVEPRRPEAAHQNEVLGGAVAVAAMQFAAGYTVVVDGRFFPDALDGLAQACRRRGVALHYAVLRADLSTCLERATSRTGERPEEAPFADLDGRFASLGPHEANVIDATGTPDEVPTAVLAALRLGAFRVPHWDRDRSPSPGVSTVRRVGDSTYELRRSSRLGGMLFLAFLPLLMLYIPLTAPAEDRASAVLAVVLVGGVYASALLHDLVWRPHRVVLTESGAILTATVREVTIPWTQLRSVQRLGAGRFSRLAWRRAHGRTIVTSDAFVDIHRMLADVERRAPGVQVTS